MNQQKYQVHVDYDKIKIKIIVNPHFTILILKELALSQLKENFQIELKKEDFFIYNSENIEQDDQELVKFSIADNETVFLRNKYEQKKLEQQQFQQIQNQNQQQLQQQSMMQEDKNPLQKNQSKNNDKKEESKLNENKQAENIIVENIKYEECIILPPKQNFKALKIKDIKLNNPQQEDILLLQFPQFYAHENFSSNEQIFQQQQQQQQMQSQNNLQQNDYEMAFPYKFEETLYSFQNRILEYLGFEEKRFSCSFYNYLGLSLTNNLTKYKSLKCKDVFNVKQMFVIISQSEIKEEEQMPEGINYSQGPHQVFMKYVNTNVINCDLQKDTILILKQKLAQKVKLPLNRINLFHGGKILKNELYCSDYNLQQHSTLEVTIRFEDNQEGINQFYSPGIKHFHTQTSMGQRALRSYLMVFKAHLNPVQKQKMIGLIRDLSNNNLPLAHALQNLLADHDLNFNNKLAIEEGLFSIFAKIILCGKEHPQNVKRNNIFEYSEICFGKIMNFLDKEVTSLPVIWKEREQFDLLDKFCSVSMKPIKKPAYLINDQKVQSIVDYDSIQALIKENKKLPGIEKMGEEKLVLDQNLTDLYNLYLKTGLRNIEIWAPQKKEYLKKFTISEDITEKKFKKFLELGDIEKSQTYMNESQYFKIYNPLDLKNSNMKPLLTTNQFKQLIIYQGTVECSMDVVVYDVMTNQETRTQLERLPGMSLEDLLNISNGKKYTHKELLEDPELLYKMIDQAKKKLSDPLVRREPKEAIVVLFDISGSMQLDFTEGLERLGACKAFFNAFADRTIAYNFSHVISLIFFDNLIEKMCGFTELFAQFKELIDLAVYRSATNLYDALNEAADELIEFKKKYPEVILRILALTDGEDNNSQISPGEVAKKILENNILIDSFVVGQDCPGLKGITLCCGGKCFFPLNLQDGIKYFEIETILRAGIRKEDKNFFEQMKKLDINELQLKIQNEFMKMPFSETGYQFLIPENMNKRIIEPQKIVQDTSMVNPNDRIKRIKKELAIFTQDPHPYIQIYPCQQDIGFWKILLMGDETTPYAKGRFLLYIEFPGNYPQQPPIIRFITPIYHCNVNSEGRICHGILGRDYTVDKNIKELISCINGLLLAPEPLDPLDSVKTTQFKAESDAYFKKAIEYTQKYAFQTVDQLAEALLGKDDPEFQKRRQELDQWIQNLEKQKK